MCQIKLYRKPSNVVSVNSLTTVLIQCMRYIKLQVPIATVLLLHATLPVHSHRWKWHTNYGLNWALPVVKWAWYSGGRRFLSKSKNTTKYKSALLQVKHLLSKMYSTLVKVHMSSANVPKVKVLLMQNWYYWIISNHALGCKQYFNIVVG